MKALILKSSTVSMKITENKVDSYGEKLGNNYVCVCAHTHTYCLFTKGKFNQQNIPYLASYSKINCIQIKIKI